MTYLYGGTILFVDLTERRIERWLTSAYSKEFLGGRGIQVKLLYDNTRPETDPLGPENFIAFGGGPLTGSALGSGRTEIEAKSPITGLLGQSNMGGHFAPELRFAGYDNVIVTGKAEKPVYITIHNDAVEIWDASGIWGKDTYDTPALIRRELGNPEVKVICIGRGGENLVRFATVQAGYGNSAGRTGMGAVMGSKNLKAIAARGTRSVKIADPTRFREVSEEILQRLRANPTVQEEGRSGVTRLQDIMYGDVGYGCAANLTEPDWWVSVKQQAATYPFLQKYLVRRDGCFNCPSQCKDVLDVPGVGQGQVSCTGYIDLAYAVKNPDPVLLWEASVYCEREGIDVQSSGNTLGWLMELYEKGVITAQDTDGIPMVWGSRDAIMGILRKIANGEGIGKVLAEGPAIAQKKLGWGSEEYVMVNKGMPMHSLNFIKFKAAALAQAVSPRGDLMRATAGEAADGAYPFFFKKEEADVYLERLFRRKEKEGGHPKAGIHNAYEGKARLVAREEELIAILDSVGTCKYLSPWNQLPYNPGYYARLLSAGLGTPVDVDSLYQIARMILLLERAYNAREGVTRETETLPKRLFDNPIKEGRYQGEVLETDRFEQMKTEYYTERGCDPETGLPMRQTLEKAGLSYVADDLEARGIILEKKGK